LQRSHGTPVHGASGPPSILYEDERIYLRTRRKIAAEKIARSGSTEVAKQAAVERINTRFPQYQSYWDRGHCSEQC